MLDWNFGGVRPAALIGVVILRIHTVSYLEQKPADFLSAPLALTGHTCIWKWSNKQNKQALHR